MARLTVPSGPLRQPTQRYMYPPTATPPEQPAAPPVVVAEPARDVHAEFLRQFLGDGPRRRTNVYREVEDSKLPGDAVRDKFVELHGREYVQKGDYYWKLPTD